MLPRMSQMAHGDRDGLRRMYGLAIKLLFSLALPTAVIVTFAAYALVTLLGGAEYLPDSAIATQLMIWSIPIGWMNSFTQYVLIAQDQQRRITGAFIIAVTFNLVTNFLFIPQYGYPAAAITTILSEAVLFVPFVLLAQGGPHGFGRVHWIALLWKPAAAGAVMFGVTLALWPVAPLIALAAGAVVYGALWIVLGVLDPDERAKLLPLLPGPLRRLARQPEPARPCA
jgi:O-antigen/teichoic acid export membrane protein